MAFTVTTRIETSPPNGKERLLAVAFYFGTAPWFRRYCLRRENSYLTHHFHHALAISALLLVILLLQVLIYACSAYLLANYRDMYWSVSVSTLYWLTTDALLNILFLIWIVVWANALVLAGQGSIFEIPVVARLARSKAVVLVSFRVCRPVYLLLIFLIGTAFHAFSLTDKTMHPASAYMLYDDEGHVPHWAFDFAFYRVSRVATAKWGRGSVVVAPISKPALEQAFQHGRFVFVATHGEKGRINTSALSYGPTDAKKAGIGEGLQLVYIASCNSGERSVQWQKALAPAEVVTFERTSYVAEHLRWLWFQGPRRISRLR